MISCSYFFRILSTRKLASLLNSICKLILTLVNLLYDKGISIFKAFKSNLNKLNLLILVKLMCLTILLTSGYKVTSNYLGFPFEYKLIVSENKYGFDFPSISVCTENNVLFDKRKIIEHFGLQIEWNDYDNILFDEFKQSIDECNQTIHNYFINRLKILRKTYPNIEQGLIYNEVLQETVRYPLKCRIKLNQSELFVDETNKRILVELNFYEMNSLTINVNQLFDCSAKVHFRNESFDSNSHEIDNCFKHFDALESIYANKDFGICFEFFVKNYSIYLKDNDFIKLNVNYFAQNNLFVNALQEMNDKFVSSILNEKYFLSLRKSLKLYFDIYFGLYFFVDSKTRLIPHNRYTALKSTKNSFNSELKITKTYVDFLGQPYMKKCTNYGKLFQD